MKLLCCTCGKQVHGHNSKNLFDKDDKEIVQNIQTLTGQLITRQTDTHTNICNPCSLQLNNAVYFREQCLTVIQKLNEFHRIRRTEDEDEIDVNSFFSLEELESDDSDFVMVYKDGEREVTMEIKPLNHNFNVNLVDHNGKKQLDDFQYDNKTDDKISESEQINPIEFASQLKNNSIKRFKKHSKPKPLTQRRSCLNGRFFCEKCFKCFTDKSNLNVHMKRHEEKKFECPECGRKEFTQHLVNLHVRIKHKGELPYACKFCGKRFDNSLKRLRHERVIHIKYDYPRNHKCSICNKSFMDRATLKFHEVVHSGEQAFHCDICNVNFNRKTSLSTHFRSKTHKKKEQEQRNNNLTRE